MLKYQSIAPAPTGEAAAGGKIRKYTPRLPNAPYAVDQTQSVQRRNARERNRVKQVNNSFAKLRQHIPQTIIADLTKGGGRGPQKKISKVDTLRIAVEYIRRLQDLVDDLNGGCDSSSSMSDVSSISFCSSSSSNSMSSAKDQEAVTSPVKQESKSPLPPFQHPAELAARLSYQQQHQQQTAFYPSALLTPESLNAFSPSHTQLDTVCHSPSSSFNSSMSFDSGTFEPTPQQLSPPHPHPAVQSSHLALKFEPYDNFHLADDECTPDDDDEILDYISLWQEQ